MDDIRYSLTSLPLNTYCKSVSLAWIQLVYETVG